MPNYSALMQRTASATLSVGSLTAAASTPHRALIDFFSFGSEASPADVAFLLQLQKSTTAGTAGSSFTPVNTGDDGATSDVVCGVAHTTDPTLTSNAMGTTFPINGRSLLPLWMMPGKQLIIPATASNGWAFRTPTMTAQAVTVTALFSQ
jgi:hypothetical protein